MTRIAALVALLAVSASAAPVLNKRIAQQTIDGPQKWRTLCEQAKGGGQCSDIAVAAAGTLLAAPDACAQQDSADKMIDLAKKLNNKQMITAAQTFRQQPRNSPDSLQSFYCTKQPKNQELNGLFQCQFQGVKLGNFGAKGPSATESKTAPNAAQGKKGACPASPNAPVPDGQQLSAIATSPGAPASQGENKGGKPGKVEDGIQTGDDETETGGDDTQTGDEENQTGGDEQDDCDNTAPDTGATPEPEQKQGAGGNGGAEGAGGAGGAGGFKLQNGLDAQKLNKKFQSLNANSPCQAGDQACVEGGFAQCVGGKFAITQCAGGTQCFALPLVNKPGTSVTCSTKDDAAARIKAAGATGGITG